MSFSRLRERFNAIGRQATPEEQEMFKDFAKKYAGKIPVYKSTRTVWFDMSVSPTINGVYEVMSDHWNSVRYARWKNGQWYQAEGSVHLAETVKDRSILLYERCNPKWRGFVERPAWRANEFVILQE